MTNNLVQFRVNEETKDKATAICEKLGIDIPTYLRICLNRLVEENGIPFPMQIKEENIGLAAMRSIQRSAKERGISDMSLEEINAEIDASRKERPRGEELPPFEKKQ